jgi:hypothetical protein
VSAALLEPTAIEVERPELAAPHVLEIRPANKITDIAQLPPIWRLAGCGKIEFNPQPYS